MPSSEQYEPGPWHGVDAPNGGAYIVAGKTRVVASLSPHVKPGRVKANARLIAAAPEMLAMLKWALDQLEVFGVANMAADSVVAKAEAKGP